MPDQPPVGEDHEVAHDGEGDLHHLVRDQHRLEIALDGRDVDAPGEAEEAGQDAQGMPSSDGNARCASRWGASHRSQGGSGRRRPSGSSFRRRRGRRGRGRGRGPAPGVYRPILPLTVTLALALAVALAPEDRRVRGGEGRANDLSGVTAVRLTGEASEVRLSAGTQAPPHAAFGSRRTGWFARWSSSWVGRACPDRASARVENETLVVDVRAAGCLELSDCVAQIDASLPAGSGVRLDQSAASLRLDGDFGEVSVRARAADLSLDGHAASIALESDAARARIAFARVEGTEAVRLTGKAVDAQLSFPAGEPVDWRVDAPASFVDGRIPSTPGAGPAVAIDGEFVRATIR